MEHVVKNRFSQILVALGGPLALLGAARPASRRPWLQLQYLIPIRIQNITTRAL
jgi:hypothetical protein